MRSEASMLNDIIVGDLKITVVNKSDLLAQWQSTKMPQDVETSSV